MAKLTEPIRARLQETFSGQRTGVPQWIQELEKGDDVGFFGPGSATWAVHGGIATIVAGIRALLVQALHPGAMAGVHDWSRYKEDPFGRLAGTIRWMMTVTYAAEADAIAGSNWVLKLHERVVGTYVDPDGTVVSYSANDPDLAAWVHIAFADSFLACHELWGSPIPGGPDAYVREWAKAGELMGVANPPRSKAELAAQLLGYLERGELRRDARVDEAVKFLRRPPLAPALRPSYPALFGGAVASIPPELQAMLGLHTRPALAIPATRAVLGSVRAVLGAEPAAESAALRRIERLRLADLSA